MVKLNMMTKQCDQTKNMTIKYGQIEYYDIKI